MVPQQNTQFEPPLPKLVSNAKDDISGSHLTLASSAIVRFDRPEPGKPKAKTPQYQAPTDLIDDDIDSSVEFTEMLPSNKFSQKSQADIQGKRKRDAKHEEVKSECSMVKSKKQKVNNNNYSVICPSISRLDVDSVFELDHSQQISKGFLKQDEVRNALFYFKSDQQLMMVHYNTNDLTFSFQEYFFEDENAMYSSDFGWLTLPLGPDNHRYIVTGLKKNRRILHEFVVS